MTWTEPSRCNLCGWTDKRDLRTGIAHWKDALPGMSYSNVTRCIDVVACRLRVEAQGDVWPLVTTTNDVSRAS